jgi:exodeoxyribonuclease V alpha subunit
MTEQQDIETVVVSGEVCDITYQNEDNGYAVFDIETDEEYITVTGSVPALFVGEKIKINGTWTNHPTYGKQLKLISFEKEMPSDSGAMLKYLSSGTIKGIGPKTAQRIIDRFGDSTFEVLESAPDMLCEIKGISPKRASEISASFNSQFGMRRVMMFFSQYFGPSLSAKIYKKWGSASVELVQSNPYRLCDEIQGIGFEKADSIAVSLGTPRDSYERIQSGIKYILNYNAYNNGHTHLPIEKLSEAAKALLEIDTPRIAEALTALAAKKEIIITASDSSQDVSLYDMYQNELYAATKLAKIASFNAEIGFADIASLISGIETTDSIKYSSEQKRAISEALTNSLYVLTGGPGTGKTTIIRAIIKIFNTLGLSFSLAAPTGRAAKRMTESTLYEAKTIHRLLEYEYKQDSNDETKFARDDANPLDCDAIIIDECSMIDLPLFSSLVRAIRPSTRLILIGDFNQLPSVGPGNILRDIIESKCFKVGHLTEIYRQSSESAIILNAHKIKEGLVPDLSNKSTDFFFMPRYTASDVMSTVVELVKTRLPKKYGDEIRAELQILCSMKKSDIGTKSMNSVFQRIENPPSPIKNEITVKDIVLREGDKVIQTKNNYQIEWTRTTLFEVEEKGSGVFNGDIGYIKEINALDETVTVEFEGRLATYDTASLDDLEHAYAITIHKSQGSEYPVVILPILKNSPLLMTRNLLYTAITRAKKMVIIVGDKDAVFSMTQNATSKRRYTKFVEILKTIYEKT